MDLEDNRTGAGSGVSPSWNLLRRSYYSLCKVLVERKLLSNDQLGELLLYSVENGYARFTKLLVQLGADVNYRAKWAYNASILMIACDGEKSNPKIVK